jgi:hypothetical protein
MVEPHKKYVVVLAHADGWGALSANKVVRHLHKRHPDVDVVLVVSNATRDKEDRIATKVQDLRISRALKEDNLRNYFRRIDEMPADTKTTEPELYTFAELGKRCCADHEVHFTSRGGPKGGEEVAQLIAGFEKQYGHGPEVLLSVDTMAILPKELLERYQCFSTHPGPLDTIKVEGMQGTLRSLVNQVLYDRNGELLPADHTFGNGLAHVKGTLFMQHPELDKGPPIATALTPVMPGMCAYEVRDQLYHVLTDKMIEQLPTLLDAQARTRLVAQATKEKAELDTKPHKRILELGEGQCATWQGMAYGHEDDSKPWGVEVLQNAILNPDYFEGQMRRFFPGEEKFFKPLFNEVFQPNLEAMAGQTRERLTDIWARLFSGAPGVAIATLDLNTGEPRATYRNPPAAGR